MLEVRLIGTFAIQCDGKPVIIPSRSAQSLLAYLILSAGISHRREKLAGMFWPDAMEEKARAYLRHELWVIRKALPSKSKTEYLIADDIHIVFNTSAEYWVDVTELMGISETASIEELMRKLSLLHGELLPGFYDDWVTQEREHLQTVYEERVAHLLELIENEKRWKDILEWGERWISIGQGPEAAYRYLMIAYDALGDRAKVTSTYQRCVQALRELDLEPSEQTRALAFKRSSKLNIPIPLTSFIGRERELKEIAELLSKSRLVTLTGSGGVGKTRLAIQTVAEVLDRFPDGIWFLDLAPLSDPALVPSTFANMLNLPEPADKKLSFTNMLSNYFRSRTAMIIFDNCEHLIESCAQLVNSLLISCEKLSILATSREALRVSGEVPYRVPSLDMPGVDTDFAIDALNKIESIRLFSDRAVSVTPSFSLNGQNVFYVTQICQRLDGIPLAIELAAARMNVLGVEQIAHHLDDRFHLLTRGMRNVLPRHQTLRATIDWSYSLLSKDEKIFFERVPIFVGGWTLESAKQICGERGVDFDILDLLTRLVEKSLVIVTESKIGMRYHMLEMTRQYANEKLVKSGEIDTLRDKHLDYFLNLGEAAAPHLIRSEQLEWLTQLDIEYENLRDALEWALSKGNAELSLRLCAALGRYWSIRCYEIEASTWLKSALSKPIQNSSSAETAARARVLYEDAELANGLDDLERMTTSAELSLTLAKEGSDGLDTAIAGFYVGLAMMRRGDHNRAAPILQESLNKFRELNASYWEAKSYGWLSSILVARGDMTIPERVSENLRLARIAGERLLLAESLVGYTIILSKYTDDAMKYAEEADLLFKQVGSPFNSSYFVFVELAWMNGELKKAKQMFLEMAERHRVIGEKYLRSDMIADLGLIAIEEGKLSEAQEYFEQALITALELEDRWFISWRLSELGKLFFLRGENDKSKQNIMECISSARDISPIQKIHPLVIILSTIYSQKPDISTRVLGAIDAFFQKVGHPIFDPRPLERYCKSAESYSRQVLGDMLFEFAFAEGQQLSLDEALDLVLKALEEM